MVNPFSNLNDKELMLKYQAGDSMAFDILYTRHKNKVYSYIAKRLHDSDDIEDLFQKIFIKFHKSRKLYDSQYDVLPWLYTITRSEFLDYVKKRKVATVEFDENLHIEVTVESGTLIDLDNEKSLSLKEKDALEQRFLNDQDFDQISLLLNTSESNARKLISRGLSKLKQKYAGAKS